MENKSFYLRIDPRGATYYEILPRMDERRGRSLYIYTAGTLYISHQLFGDFDYHRNNPTIVPTLFKKLCIKRRLM
jgi:hypothetical protein